MGTKEEKLHTAVFENNKGDVETLVGGGVDINCIYYGTTPLVIAVSKAHADLAKWLMDHGADVKYKDANNTSAFEETILNNIPQLAQPLSSHGCDINQTLNSGQTALCHAVNTNSLPLAEALIKAGCDLNKRNMKGETPLYIASHGGKNTFVKLLIQNKCDTNAACGREKQSPLICAIANEYWDTAKLLIKAGCDLNYGDKDGWTALWHSVSNNNEDIVKMLVSVGADINIRDSNGRTVLHEAVDNEDEDIIDILKKAQKIT